MKTCKCCKKSYNLEDYDGTLVIPRVMKNENLCFECALWKYQADKNQKENQPGIPVVTSKFYRPTAEVNPRYYGFLPFQTRSIGSNFALHPTQVWQPNYRILFDDGRLYTANNFWQIGQIPPRFYNKFKVNAKLLSNQEALMLISRRDTKVAEGDTHYIISNEGLKQIKYFNYED